MKYRKNSMENYYVNGSKSLALDAKNYFNEMSIRGHILRAELLCVCPHAIGHVQPADNAIISQAVASLPPEQMHELMKQMKLCIENNPNEARNMLLQNQQLAYALLQAQIVMKIVDPQVAIAILSRAQDQIPETYTITQPSPVIASEASQSLYQPHFSSTESVGKGFFREYALQIPQRTGLTDPRSRRHETSGNVKPFKESSTNEDIQNLVRSGIVETNKAEMIYQVLNLSEREISLLPEDQKSSIDILKQQLKKSG